MNALDHRRATLPALAGLSLFVAATQSAMAMEYGRVLSSTPIYEPVSVPERECTDHVEAVEPHTSGAGAVIGAVVGGVVGSHFGRGDGRLLGTGVGAVAGASVGDRAEAANGTPETRNVRECRDATRMETQLTGYDVLYRYDGREYRTRLAHDPGAEIALNVDVTPAGSSFVPIDAPGGPPTVTYVTPGPVVYAYPEPYYVRPYYAGPRYSVEVHSGFDHHHWR